MKYIKKLLVALAFLIALVFVLINIPENRKDINEIKPEYIEGLTFHYVNEMSEVLAIAVTKEKAKNAKKL